MCVCVLCSLFKAEDMAQDLLQWSVADVVSYFTAVGFPEQAVAFRTQVSPKRKKKPCGFAVTAK